MLKQKLQFKVCFESKKSKVNTNFPYMKKKVVTGTW